MGENACPTMYLLNVFPKTMTINKNNLCYVNKDYLHKAVMSACLNACLSGLLLFLCYHGNPQKIDNRYYERFGKL